MTFNKKLLQEIREFKILMPEQIKNKSGIATIINEIDFEKYDCMFATFNNEALKIIKNLALKFRQNFWLFFIFKRIKIIKS